VVKIAYNITPQKENEKLIQKYADNLQAVNTELDQFAYIVSHDLKAPLRGISTLATFISEDYSDKLDEDGKEQMKLLLSRVSRMNGLITGILEYSRIGRAKQEKESVDLETTVNQIVDLIVPVNKFEVKIKHKLPTLKIEKVLIEQIFQNLISNAVKYNDKDKGKIEIDCKEEGKFWQFSVTDNGPGIEQQYFNKIFQIFQTLNSRDDVEGTGIGLSLVKKTIEHWRGKIWVESKLGEGTSFIFTIPKKH
jgi:light-regulated signal transduction histidine kinase (bacteriophytochrome)